MIKNNIIIKGARTHNLKNIDIEIPRNKLVVITGLSGSGKSSLAFDTIYAESQRRYLESLSSYAKQFIGSINKPDVDLIESLPPTIAIHQKYTAQNPRSTVGTITEIYDYLRLLFARVGIVHCPKCNKEIKEHSIAEIIQLIQKQYKNQKIIILSVLTKDKILQSELNLKSKLNELVDAEIKKIRLNGKIHNIHEIKNTSLHQYNKQNIDAVVKIAVLTKSQKAVIFLEKYVKKAFELSNGAIIIISVNNCKPNETIYFQKFACLECGITIPKLEPYHFSFNSPHGACQCCSGIGTKFKIDPKLAVNFNLTIAQGAIKPFKCNVVKNFNQKMSDLEVMAKKYSFNINTQLKNLTKQQLNFLFYGAGIETEEIEKTEVRLRGAPRSRTSVFSVSVSESKFNGILNILEQCYCQSNSDFIRKEIKQYMQIVICPECNGKQLKPEALAVKINDLSIHDITSQSIDQIISIFNGLIKLWQKNKKIQKITSQIIQNIQSRLKALSGIGLGYLTLNRSVNTLSGGEIQRVRLAGQMSSNLVNILYILDEPSIGMLQKDINKLISILKKLRDSGNSAIVVEHDADIMRSADYIIDIGPGAGENGGKVVAKGSVSQIKKSTNSLTGQYLSGEKFIPMPVKQRVGSGKFLKIIGADEHNLKNIDVKLPLGKLIVITGVSGSGKSTLMIDILAKTLAQKFYRAKENPGKHKEILGLEFINKVININQSPIGRTPRSNPVTYTGAFSHIRELFASVPEAIIKGYKKSYFSFNIIGGRCEACSGDGMIKIEMQFLPDIYVECEICHGNRYNNEALEIYYKKSQWSEESKNISDVLNMTVESAMNFFKNTPSVYQKLSMLYDVGLGYIKLGQSATTLSGGEAQRIKLAAELSRCSTGKTLYILDEPTTGLHFDDIKKLLSILNQLVDKGNTVLIIEHNLDVIKSSDWIVDLGPEGGDKGGEIIAQGTPKDIIKIKKSWTGQYLKSIIN